MFNVLYRCCSVINPIKSEMRSAESWRSLVSRIRYLMLVAYDKRLSHFEDIIREQRENRNHPNWNFCHYFLLQVNLTQVLIQISLLTLIHYSRKSLHLFYKC